MREENIGRLKNYKTDVNDKWFLHHRSLFVDLEEAASHAHGKLLDIGCGNKPYKHIFENRIAEYIGCDVVQSSERCVDIICQADSIPIKNNAIDTILCTQVLEHVADHRGLLRETFRLLQKGGVLILSCPMYWPLHEEPYDFFRFTEHGLRYLLESAGFVIHKIKCNGGKWALCGQVIIHTIDNTRLYNPFLVKMINHFFAYMDDRRQSYTNPMNYVLVAYKS